MRRGTPSTIVWNMMLLAFARRRMGRQAIDLFNEMNASKVEVDTATFTTLLSACAHSNLSSECLDCYQQMEWKYSIHHLSCIYL